MASALDIIHSALRQLNVIAARETANAEDAEFSLGVLNRLLASYEARGCETAPNPQMTATGAVLTLDESFHQALIDVLAEKLAKPFGIPVTAEIMADAGRGDRQILKAFVTRGTFGVDNALHPTRMSGTRTSWDGVS